MEAYQQLIIVIGSLAGFIILLKIFYTIWGLLERKLFPERFSRPDSAPEVLFKDLHKKEVVIYLKNGETVEGRYKKSLYFGDGDFGITSPVYFELILPEKQSVYVSGDNIWKIETKKY